VNKRACFRGRRRFVRITALGLVLGPMTTALLRGEATAAEPVSETEPRAVALKYRRDATRSTDRKDPTAVCDNCNLYTGKPGDATGTCELFDGRLVAAKGWCASWEGY
jgi:high potential iron-sulfur protein